MFSLHSEKLATRIANITALLVALILCVRFSRAYSSYAYAIFVLFIIYDLTCFRKPALFSLYALRPIRTLCIGLLTFYGLCMLSSLLLQDVESVKKCFGYISLALPFFIVYLLEKKYNINTCICAGLLLGGLIMCLGGIFMDSQFSPRIHSFFPHPNLFGSVLSILLPFTLYFAVRANHLSFKLLAFLLLPLQLYCLWHTESRGAIVGLSTASCLSLFIYLFISYKKLNWKIIFLLILTAVLSISAGLAVLTQINEERNEWGKMGGERALMLEASYNMWQDHKLLGIGLANWRNTYYSETYHPTEGHETNLNMPHNMPIYFLSTAGILGIIGFLVFLTSFLWAIYMCFTQSNNSFLTLITLISFLTFTIHGLVDKTFIAQDSCRVFFLLMGYSFSLLNVKQSKNLSY